MKNVGTQLQFHTFIQRLGIVGVETFPSCRWIEVDISQDIRTHLAIYIKGSRQAMLQYREIKTEVPRGSLLPTQLVVWWSIQCSFLLACDGIRSDSCRQVRGIAGIDVTSYTIAETKFQHIEPLGIFHKLLVVEIPTCTH